MRAERRESKRGHERQREQGSQRKKKLKRQKRENNQKCVKTFIGSQLGVRTHKKLLQKKKRIKSY